MLAVTIVLNIPDPLGYEGIGLEHRIREALEDMGSEYTSVRIEQGDEDPD